MKYGNVLVTAAAKARAAFTAATLFSLVAVGVHAAGDAFDDRLLWMVDGVDTFFDRLFGLFSWSAPLVDVIGLEARTVFARGVALVWEVAVLGVVALPIWRYGAADLDFQFSQQAAWEAWREDARRLGRSPTLFRVLHPIATAAMAVAGAAAVAQSVRGVVYLSLQGAVGGVFARFSSGLVAAATLLLVGGAAGLGAVLASLRWSARLSETEVQPAFVRARRTVAALLIIPFVLAAFFEVPVLWSIVSG